MQFSIFLLLFAITCVKGKNYVKSLTESLGQEVIEIGAPVKDLPAGLDEEPSAEYEQEETTPATTPPLTKRETRKTSTLPSSSVVLTEEDKEDTISQEEEESRIEKELSEIYKDTDYKAETKLSTKKEIFDTTTKEASKKPIQIKLEKTQPISKPIARLKAKTNFKFQPDVNNREDVERFRTSIDEISCDKHVTQKLHQDTTNEAADRVVANTIILSSAFVSTLVCL